MNTSEIYRLVEKYERRFKNLGIQPVKFDPLTVMTVKHKRDEAMSHCYWLLGEVRDLFRSGETEKGLEWLGFIQGCFWSRGFYKFIEIEKDNK